MNHFLYCTSTDTDHSSEPPLPHDYHFEIWRPSLLHWPPKGTPHHFMIWCIFHHFRIFKNREFSLFLMKRNRQIVHHSLVSPNYFRFPFMADIDLTVGGSFTEPAHRKKGLYTFVLIKTAKIFAKPGRKIWTIHAQGNEGSQKAFLKAGYEPIGRVERTKRLGLKLFGAYQKIS